MIAITATTFCIDNGITTEKIGFSYEPFLCETEEALNDIRKQGEQIFSDLSHSDIKIVFDTTNHPGVINNIKLSFPMWLAFPQDYVPIINEKKHESKG